MYRFLLLGSYPTRSFHSTDRSLPYTSYSSLLSYKSPRGFPQPPSFPPLSTTNTAFQLQPHHILPFAPHYPYHARQLPNHEFLHSQPHFSSPMSTSPPLFIGCQKRRNGFLVVRPAKERRRNRRKMRGRRKRRRRKRKRKERRRKRGGGRHLFPFRLHPLCDPGI